MPRQRQKSTLARLIHDLSLCRYLTLGTYTLSNLVRSNKYYLLGSWLLSLIKTYGCVAMWGNTGPVQLLGDDAVIGKLSCLPQSEFEFIAALRSMN